VQEEIAEGARATYFCVIHVKLEWDEAGITRMLVQLTGEIAYAILGFGGFLASARNTIRFHGPLLNTILNRIALLWM
jgi:hypothetical protein